ncbi:MAG: EFR1 family ferrodoxin [Clostridia bacterium]|nr:EFR1 family ferrodoxin [Clostridia bacterium]
MILYFTGTGNSEYCARFIADRIGDECINLAERIRVKDFSSFESEKPWIICVPTYAWKIPAVVTELLGKAELKGSKDVYFVMTCGGQIGKAEKYNKALCDKIGKSYKGTAKVKMAENYLAMFEVTTPDEEELLMKEANVNLEQVSELIKKNESLPEVREGAIGALLSGKVNEMFNKYYLRDDKFTVKDNCTSCGLCAKKCPLGNVEIKDGKPLWKGNCTHCMACICNCPVEAIEYGKKSVGKRRYLCRRFEG